MVVNHARGKNSQPWHQAPNNYTGKTKCGLDTVNKSGELYGAGCIVKRITRTTPHTENT